MCPANWKPGARTIKPDQEAKTQYFKAAFSEDKPIDRSKFDVKITQEGSGDYA